MDCKRYLYSFATSRQQQRPHRCRRAARPGRRWRAKHQRGLCELRYIDAQSNAHRQVGSYTTTTGEIRTATDIWVPSNATQSLPTDWVAVSDGIDVRAYEPFFTANANPFPQAKVRHS